MYTQRTQSRSATPSPPPSYSGAVPETSAKNPATVARAAPRSIEYASERPTTPTAPPRAAPPPRTPRALQDARPKPRRKRAPPAVRRPSMNIAPLLASIKGIRASSRKVHDDLFRIDRTTRRLPHDGSNLVQLSVQWDELTSVCCPGCEIAFVNYSLPMLIRRSSTSIWRRATGAQSTR